MSFLCQVAVGVAVNVISAPLVYWLVQRRLPLLQLRRDFADTLLGVVVSAARLRALGEQRDAEGALPAPVRPEVERLAEQLDERVIDLLDDPGMLTYLPRIVSVISDRTITARGVMLDPDRSPFGKADTVVDLIEPLRQLLFGRVWRRWATIRAVLRPRNRR